MTEPCNDISQLAHQHWMYPIRTHRMCMFTFCKWSLSHLPPPSFPESALRHHSMGSFREESASKLRLFRYFDWQFQLQANFGPPNSLCMLLFYILPGFGFACLLACLLVFWSPIFTCHMFLSCLVPVRNPHWSQATLLPHLLNPSNSGNFLDHLYWADFSSQHMLNCSPASQSLDCTVPRRYSFLCSGLWLCFYWTS